MYIATWYRVLSDTKHMFYIYIKGGCSYPRGWGEAEVDGQLWGAIVGLQVHLRREWDLSRGPWIKCLELMANYY